MATLGTNVKLHVTRDKLPAFSEVMTSAFGAKVAATTPTMTIFDLEGAHIGAEVVEAHVALSDSEAKDRGTWIELLVDEPEQARRALSKLGIEPFAYVDSSRDYYQLPGGQVARVARRS